MRIATSALLGMTVTFAGALGPAMAAPPAQGQAADVPPVPPPPGGQGTQAEAPPPLPPAFPSESRDGGRPLAGWHNGFFIRDPKDYFHIYPRLRIHLDFNSYLGPGVNDVSAADGGNSLKTRFFLRRLMPEMAGYFLKRWTFNGGFEVTQPLGNANGRTELSAGAPGTTPTGDTAAFAPVQAVNPGIGAADVYINYGLAPWLNIMFGQYNAPFSMENRTSDKFTTMMERNVAIRGFVVPSTREIGITVWGEIGDRKLNYEVGAFIGDGQNRPQIDNRFDFIGRIFARPLPGSLSKAQIGMSARHGDRDLAYVGYDYAAITTGQGFGLWNPQYRDSLGRLIHVIPSGAQNQIGGELRLPIAPFDVRGEAYYVSNNTREAVDGYQLTNTERLGSMRGVGWYAQVSVWPWGDAFLIPDPGFFRPLKVDLSKPVEPIKRGLELAVVVAGVNANYNGASRKGLFDANTPGGPYPGSPSTDITIYQYGFGINYWHSTYVRATFNYNVYHTPNSGSPDNLAVVPGNIGQNPTKGAHVLHELGGRLAISF